MVLKFYREAGHDKDKTSKIVFNQTNNVFDGIGQKSEVRPQGLPIW